MPEFVVLAKVDQVVTKEVRIVVEASSEEEAKEKCTRALSEYPDKVYEPGITRMITLNSHAWIPKSIDFTAVRGKKDA